MQYTYLAQENRCQFHNFIAFQYFVFSYVQHCIYLIFKNKKSKNFRKHQKYTFSEKIESRCLKETTNFCGLITYIGKFKLEKFIYIIL